MYSTRVSHRRPIILWTRLAVVALVTSGRFLFADDQAPPSDGYKTVNADGSDGKLPVRVKEQPDALAHAHLTDELDHQRAFSATNQMANKSYAFTADSMAGTNADYNKKSDQNTFITKSYSLNKTSSVPGLDSKATFNTTPLSSTSNTEFGKSFNTASADLGPKSSFATSKASEQDRTAVLGGHTTDTFASTLGDKTFTGDEATAAKTRLTRLQNGQMYVQDLPNRDLTIDEVRDLINHGFKPDTDKAPQDQESKPLNDPNYVPQAIRESPDAPTPVATPVSDEDKDDAVPPPGTMSATPPPENSQALPQK